MPTEALDEKSAASTESPSSSQEKEKEKKMKTENKSSSDDDEMEDEDDVVQKDNDGEQSAKSGRGVEDDNTPLSTLIPATVPRVPPLAKIAQAKSPTKPSASASASLRNSKSPTAPDLPISGVVTRDELEVEITRSSGPFGDRLEKVKTLRNFEAVAWQKVHEFVPKHLQMELADALDYRVNVASSAAETAEIISDIFLVLEKSMASKVSLGTPAHVAVRNLCLIDPEVEKLWSGGVAAKKRILSMSDKKRKAILKRKAPSSSRTADTGADDDANSRSSLSKKRKDSGGGGTVAVAPTSELQHDLFLPNYVSNTVESRLIDHVRKILIDRNQEHSTKIIAGGVYRTLKGSDNDSRELARTILTDLYRNDIHCDPTTVMNAIAYVCGLHK